jgi:hypothetical protein
LQAEISIALSDEIDTGRWGLSEMTVGDALTADAAKSNNTTTKVFALPLDKFFSTLQN